MGINGLLPALKPCLNAVHIREYKGKRLAVDAYVWLHKGAFSCAEELCQGIATEKYLNFCSRMVGLLLHYGVIPVIVFDGDRLPMKSGEEHTRKSSRKENLQKAKSLVQAGNYGDAKKYFQQAVDVSPTMAKRFIEMLKTKNVEYIVAPYEADAQLGFLARTGYVDGVITEDSDMIPYGVPLVLYKLKSNGSAEEFHRSRLMQASKLNFHRFDQDKIITMCVLNGCDYLDSLPGIGIVTAHRFVSHYGNAATIFHHLRRQKGIRVSKEYEEAFYRAFLTFKHQMVYDPRTKQMVYFSELPPELHGQDTSFLGQFYPPDMAYQIATGDIHPMTKEPFDARKPVMYAHQEMKTASQHSTQEQQKITFFSKTTKKKSKPRVPFKPPRPSSSQGCVSQGNKASQSQDSEESISPTLATTTTTAMFSTSTTRIVCASDDSIKSKVQDITHVPLILNQQRKGRLTLPPWQSNVTRSIISTRIQRKSLMSPSQEQEDEFSSDSDDNIASPQRKRLSLAIVPKQQKQNTTPRSAIFSCRETRETSQQITTRITETPRHHVLSQSDDSSSSSGTKKRHRTSQEDCCPRPTKKSRFFSKSMLKGLGPLPAKRQPLPPQTSISTKRMLTHEEEISFALDPRLEVCEQQNERETTPSKSVATTPAKGRTLIQSPLRIHTHRHETPQRIKREASRPDGHDLKKKFSTYIMEDVINIDDESDGDQPLTTPTTDPTQFLRDGELVNSSSPPHSPRGPSRTKKTPSLFMNFLEKCKAKNIQHTTGELRKMGGEDNPIVL
uniref:Exonuclease 1 n=1 Tax=Percolomonas cosmopolitus TaxID=63605 RepID=A0A7S1KUX0_9EUKA|mmetsp:Transcript_9599/g.35575  ORF Transcript_9599/g.35575 Transcript_9599/m.35575 type:complete len:783 (+) Transcript_9599:337-2685(+)